MTSASRRAAPANRAVLRAIATRELRLASRRRVVRWLFLFSLLPVLVFATILAVRLWSERNLAGMLEWDPVREFLQFQTLPIGLVTLAVGIPSVARDRAHDVLFLYATRPVQPRHYVLGKWLSTAVPAAALLLLPATAIAVLRWSLLSQVSTGESLMLIARAGWASLLIGGATAGVCLGASAAVKRDRTGYLLALAVFFVPEVVAQAVSMGQGWGGPFGAAGALIDALFGAEDPSSAALASLVLGAYGAAGLGLAAARVRREMVP